MAEPAAPAAPAPPAPAVLGLPAAELPPSALSTPALPEMPLLLVVPELAPHAATAHRNGAAHGK